MIRDFLDDASPDVVYFNLDRDDTLDWLWADFHLSVGNTGIELCDEVVNEKQRSAYIKKLMIIKAALETAIREVGNL